MHSIRPAAAALLGTEGCAHPTTTTTTTGLELGECHRPYRLRDERVEGSEANKGVL